MTAKQQQPTIAWEIANIDDLIAYWRDMRAYHVNSIKAVDQTIQSLSDEREKLVKRLEQEEGECPEREGK